MNTKNIVTLTCYIVAFLGVIALKIWSEPIKELLKQFFEFITQNDSKSLLLLISSFVALVFFVSVRNFAKKKSISFLDIVDVGFIILPVLAYLSLVSYLFRKEISHWAKLAWAYIEPIL